MILVKQIQNLLKKIFSKLPESLDGVKPVLLYPLLGIFLIGVIMQFVVEPPIGALNTAINNGLNGLNGASAVVLGVLLGGMMAIDMYLVQLQSLPETTISWQQL